MYKFLFDISFTVDSIFVGYWDLERLGLMFGHLPSIRGFILTGYTLGQPQQYDNLIVYRRLFNG